MGTSYGPKTLLIGIGILTTVLVAVLVMAVVLIMHHQNVVGDNPATSIFASSAATPTSATTPTTTISSINSTGNSSFFGNFDDKGNLVAAAPNLPYALNTVGFSDAAQMLLSGMDTSVDPCQDFFQYSCGRYFKEPSCHFLAEFSQRLTIC